MLRRAQNRQEKANGAIRRPFARCSDTIKVAIYWHRKAMMCPRPRCGGRFLLGCPEFVSWDRARRVAALNLFVVDAQNRRIQRFALPVPTKP
jgi:hypothetical protein